MKKVFVQIFAVALFFAAACTPKSGDKMSKTPTEKPAEKTTVIPIPTGNVRANSPKPGSPPTINIGKAATFSLENGLKVILVENHKLPKVSFQIFVDAGPISEGEAAGYTDMFGDLLAKGTATRTKTQIDNEVDFLGASINSSANGVSGECLTRHSEKLLDLMSDILLHPVFPVEELEKDKTRTLSGLATQKSNADAIARNVAAVLRNTKFHPYGELTTEASVAKISIEKIKNYYQTYFKPNISYLVITGDIDQKLAEKFAKKYFGKWQRGEVKRADFPPPAMPEKTKIDFVNKEGAVQSVINITYPVNLHPADQDIIRARLMNTILGGYFNSRLNANLREGHAYTYGAGSGLSPDEVVGSFTASASVRNAVTDSAVLQFLYELNHLRDVKVPAKELQLVKNVMTGSFSRSLEDPGTVAAFALRTARFNLPADYYEKYLAVLNAVTAEEIQAMAKKYVHPANAHILVVGNKGEVAEKLAKFSSDGKINYLDIYGNPERQFGKIPDGVTAETIILDYVNAIGGLENIKKIKDIRSVVAMKTGGPVLTMTNFQKVPGKFLSVVQMNNQTMSKQVLNGEKSLEHGMGGATRAVEGENLVMLKENAMPSKEAFYLQNGYKLKLVGVENLDGKNIYLLEVTRPDGSKFSEYYDMATSLKFREVQITGDGEEKQTMQTEFSDYRAVEGVLFAHAQTLTGIYPTPIQATISEIKVNEGIEDSVFEIK